MTQLCTKCCSESFSIGKHIKSYSKMNVTPFVRGSVVIKKNKVNEGLLVEGVNYLPSFNHSVNEKGFINDDEIIIGSSLAESLKLDSSEVLILVPLDGFITCLLISQCQFE